MLLALSDGRALPASVLAKEAGISASTASSHLAHLTQAYLLRVEQHGRFRYFRILITEADANNNPTDYAYDAVGNLIQMTDALGIKTQMTYDALNRLKTITQDSDGIKATTQFEYDALDQLIKVTDPRGLSTTYDINALGDLQSVSSPDAGTTTYTYIRSGVLGKSVDARGVTTTWDYDEEIRPVLTQWTQGASQIALRATYDVAPAICGPNERYPVERLSSMQRDPGALTQYCYSPLDGVSQKAETIDGQTLAVHYTYTPGSHLQTLTYPDGMVVDYTNVKGRVTEIGVTLPGQSRQVLLNQIGYYPFGPISGWVFGNGRSVQRAYDKNYRPKQFTDLSPGGLAIGFDFDPNGQLTSIVPLAGTSPDVGVQYDSLGRVSNFVQKSNQALIDKYTYDVIGNRIRSVHNGVPQQCTYPTTSNRLLSAGGLLRTYDALGNTTSIGGDQLTFTYDPQGRMTEAKRNVAIWTWDIQGEPFGDSKPNQDPDNDGTQFTLDLRFPGQRYDSATGLYQNDHRDYDPRSGRYLQSDPIGLAGGINPYIYVLNNPFLYIDPHGLASCTYSITGQRLSCTPDNPENSPVDIHAASGNNGPGFGGCKNNPACTAYKNHGPIPEGDWHWNIDGEGYQNNKPNGRRLVPDPGTDTFGRNGFLTHSCRNAFGRAIVPKYCSAGCIFGDEKDFQSLNLLLDAEPDSTLKVIP